MPIWFQLFLAAAFGAFVLYVLNQLNDRQPFSLFTALRMQLKDRPFLILVDMIISSCIGAGVVMVVLDPTTIAAAGTGGLGLTGILSAVGKNA